MRAFQDFDLRQVGILAVECAGVRVQDTVDDQGKVGFGIPGAVEAADAELGVAYFYGVHQGDAGCLGNKIFGALYAHVFNVGIGERGDRGWHVVQGFFACSRCHDHFLELSHCHAAVEQGGHDGEDQEERQR